MHLILLNELKVIKIHKEMVILLKLLDLPVQFWMKMYRKLEILAWKKLSKNQLNLLKWSVCLIHTWSIIKIHREIRKGYRSVTIREITQRIAAHQYREIITTRMLTHHHCCNKFIETFLNVKMHSWAENNSNKSEVQGKHKEKKERRLLIQVMLT